MAWALNPSLCPSSLNVTDNVLFKLFVPAGKKSLSSPVPVLAFDMAAAATEPVAPLLVMVAPLAFIPQVKLPGTLAIFISNLSEVLPENEHK